MVHGKARPAGFTLVEVMIVVSIMAILAAVAVSQFGNPGNDAKISTAKANLRALRMQIELYRAQHQGQLPSSNLAELAQKTDLNGGVGTDPSQGFVLGPYVNKLPVNPFNGSNTVVAINDDPPVGTIDGAGWLYNPAVNKVWVNDTNIPFADQ